MSLDNKNSCDLLIKNAFFFYFPSKIIDYHVRDVGQFRCQLLEMPKSTESVRQATGLDA